MEISLLAKTQEIVSLRACISQVIIIPNISEAISRHNGIPTFGREIATSGIGITSQFMEISLLAKTQEIVSLRACISHAIIIPNISEAISRQDGLVAFGREIATSGISITSYSLASPSSQKHKRMSLRASIPQANIYPILSEAISRHDGITTSGREIATSGIGITSYSLASPSSQKHKRMSLRACISQAIIFLSQAKQSPSKNMEILFCRNSLFHFFVCFELFVVPSPNQRCSILKHHPVFTVPY